MKTLIFFASPRKNGITMRLVKEMQNKFSGEINVIDCYNQKNILPCTDCRHCWTNYDCIIKDDMTYIYKLIEESDNIVFATPVYFHSVPSVLKIIIDRFQVYWAACKRNQPLQMSAKTGGTILVGGAPEFNGQFSCCVKLFDEVFKLLGCKYNFNLNISNTDKITKEELKIYTKQIGELSNKINRNEAEL